MFVCEVKERKADARAVSVGLISLSGQSERASRPRESSLSS